MNIVKNLNFIQFYAKKLLFIAIYVVFIASNNVRANPNEYYYKCEQLLDKSYLTELNNVGEPNVVVLQDRAPFLLTRALRIDPANHLDALQNPKILDMAVILEKLRNTNTTTEIGQILVEAPDMELVERAIKYVVPKIFDAPHYNDEQLERAAITFLKLLKIKDLYVSDYPAEELGNILEGNDLIGARIKKLVLNNVKRKATIQEASTKAIRKIKISTKQKTANLKETFKIKANRLKDRLEKKLLTLENRYAVRLAKLDKQLPTPRLKIIKIKNDRKRARKKERRIIEDKIDVLKYEYKIKVAELKIIKKENIKKKQELLKTKLTALELKHNNDIGKIIYFETTDTEKSKYYKEVSGLNQLQITMLTDFLQGLSINTKPLDKPLASYLKNLQDHVRDGRKLNFLKKKPNQKSQVFVDSFYFEQSTIAKLATLMSNNKFKNIIQHIYSQTYFKAEILNTYQFYLVGLQASLEVLIDKIRLTTNINSPKKQQLLNNLGKQLTVLQNKLQSLIINEKKIILSQQGKLKTEIDSVLENLDSDKAPAYFDSSTNYFDKFQLSAAEIDFMHNSKDYTSNTELKFNSGDNFSLFRTSAIIETIKDLALSARMQSDDGTFVLFDINESSLADWNSVVKSVFRYFAQNTAFELNFINAAEISSDEILLNNFINYFYLDEEILLPPEKIFYEFQKVAAKKIKEIYNAPKTELVNNFTITRTPEVEITKEVVSQDRSANKRPKTVRSKVYNRKRTNNSKPNNVRIALDSSVNLVEWVIKEKDKYKKSINDLNSNTEYKMYLHNDPTNALYTVTFSDTVLEFAQAKPVIFRKMLRALTSRKLAMNDSASIGIKNLFNTVQRGNKKLNLVEIKPGKRNMYRGIAVPSEKATTLHFAEIVHHDDVENTAKKLEKH